MILRVCMLYNFWICQRRRINNFLIIYSGRRGKCETFKEKKLTERCNLTCITVKQMQKQILNIKLQSASISFFHQLHWEIFKMYISIFF